MSFFFPPLHLKLRTETEGLAGVQYHIPVILLLAAKWKQRDDVFAPLKILLSWILHTLLTIVYLIFFFNLYRMLPQTVGLLYVGNYERPFAKMKVRECVAFHE